MRTRIVIASAAIAGLAAVSVAFAHDTSYRTSTSFGFGTSPDAALGFVDSPNGGCVGGRRAKLYRERSGRDPVVGTDRTDSAGFWEVRENLRNNAKYYARITKKNIGSGGHDHICRSYRTSTLRFPGGTPARG